jgi:hypothetical protein
MEEADTSNNRTVIEPLNSANSAQHSQTSCPFYSVVQHENIVVKDLPLLKPAGEQQYDTVVVNFSENTIQEEWVAEPEKDQQALIDSEFQKLLALNEELRAANTKLYEQVEQLKTELAESQKVLQWQKTRSSVTESMLNQQTQELGAAREQIKSLHEQLETALQNVQHQEISNEAYKAQFQISQQRIAQLERECCLLHTNYSEQSQQLLESENTSRELRTRLLRQQRQTLQFKAALEKCLDTNVPDDNNLDDSSDRAANTTKGQSRFSRKARSLFPNAQPIKPWSAEPELPEEPAIPTLEIEVGTTTPNSSNLDQQLDTLIQMFFTSQPENHPEAEPLIVETVATTLGAHEELEPVLKDDSGADWLGNLTLSPELSNPETEDYWSETQPLDESTANPKSPSPIVYPNRPPKGRKSLAAVELPKFGPKT